MSKGSRVFIIYDENALTANVNDRFSGILVGLFDS